MSDKETPEFQDVSAPPCPVCQSTQVRVGADGKLTCTGCNNLVELHGERLVIAKPPVIQDEPKKEKRRHHG